MPRTTPSKKQAPDTGTVVILTAIATAAACIASAAALLTSVVTLRRSWPPAGPLGAAPDYRQRSISDVKRAGPVRHAAPVPPENPHSPPTPHLGNPEVRR